MLASSELTGRSRATVARPRLVESVKGMQNHMTPPSRYPCHAAVGVEDGALHMSVMPSGSGSKHVLMLCTRVLVALMPLWVWRQWHSAHGVCPQARL